MQRKYYTSGLISSASLSALPSSFNSFQLGTWISLYSGNLMWLFEMVAGVITILSTSKSSFRYRRRYKFADLLLPTLDGLSLGEETRSMFGSVFDGALGVVAGDERATNDDIGDDSSEDRMLEPFNLKDASSEEVFP